MKNIYLLFCFTLFICNGLNATTPDKRTQLADTVANLMNNKLLTDSIKAIRLSELALMDYLLDINIEKSAGYIQTALTYANKWNNDDPKVFVYSNKMQMATNIEETETFVDSCIYYTQHSQNPLVRSIGWQNLAKVKAHTPEALEYLLKALEEIKDKGYWAQEQSLYYDITHYYHISVTDYPQLPVYAQLSLEAALKLGDDYIIAKSWHDVGVAYYVNFTIDPENYDLLQKSYDAFAKTYDMYVDGTIDNSIREYSLLYVTTLVNFSNIVYIIQEYQEAIDYMKEALEMALAYHESNEIDYNMKPYIYHNSIMYILQSYSTLGKMSKEMGNYNQAEDYLLKALAFLPNNIVDDIRNDRYPAYRLNFELADLYSVMGKYKEATKYYDAGLKEYISNYEFQLYAMTEHLANAYEEDKKERELNFLNESLSLKTTQNYLFIILIIILIVTLAMIYGLLRFRLLSAKKLNQEKENETKILRLSKEQEEIEARLKELQTEKYQKELLAGSLLVDHKNNVLDELRILFSSNPALSKHKKELEEILSGDAEDKKETDSFKTDLQDIHPIFYARLQKQADNKLTALDLKYCHMIFMKMSSKEIADILQVDPKTVRITKYRLKQKLNLDKSEDLNSFVEQVAALTF